MEESPWQRLLVTAITAAGMGLMIWLETPEWQREAAKRMIRFRLHRAAARLARASGRRAMGDELAGHLREALAGYDITYRLSRLRDRL